MSRDYYCSMKFKHLKIDAESNLTYCCHAAAPHSIDKVWLKENPGQLFNTPILLKERTMMLQNERNLSCEQNCWPAEDIGSISPRMYQKGSNKTHTNINQQPEEIDITLTSECNLTCSYCCKEYSLAWKRDLIEHGDYNIDSTRYKLNAKDKVLYKLSQSEKINSTGFQDLVNEIKLISTTLDRLIITGGEPFLNNQLLSVVDIGKNCSKIVLYTGLGVTYTRLEKILNQLKAYPNVELRVSAENVGKYLEFNRYGIQANEFIQKVNLIKSTDINFKFSLTLTNLTIFGLAEFYKTFSDSNLDFTYAYQPNFMAINVLDDLSKKYLLEELTLLPEKHYNDIKQSIVKEPTELQRTNLKTFINKFIASRNLDLNIYPPNFINWIN